MIISKICIILLFTSLAWATRNPIFTVKRVSNVLATTTLETPNWSAEENALYFIDFRTHTFFRLDGETGKITSKNITCGPLGLIIPLQGSPGYVIVAIRQSLYVMNSNACDLDDSLTLLLSVDYRKRGNTIYDGKVDAAGRLWFGTIGKILSPFKVEPGKGSLYVMTNETYGCPRVPLRPLDFHFGLAWSKDNKKFYLNDAMSKQISSYDFNLDTGEIANRTILLDFGERGISGIPNGMTIDSDGMLWVATYTGGKVLRIDPNSSDILLEIGIPLVDQVSSVTWGGEKMDVLYVLTGKFLEDNPKPHSGCLFAITVEGCRGVPQNYMRLSGVEDY